MVNKRTTNDNHKLGSLLLKKGYICQAQLESALEYQQKHQVKLGAALIELKLINQTQLKLILAKQKRIRQFAAALAMLCIPWNPAIASEDKSAKSDSKANHSQIKIANNNENLVFTAYDLDQASKEFYYSGKETSGLSYVKNFSDRSGLKFDISKSEAADYETNFLHKFSPQISLFKSSYKPTDTKPVSTTNIKRFDRYTNTIPAVFMLTLKGRSLYENSGNETNTWSLKKANKGVQREATLMLSITKQF